MSCSWTGACTASGYGSGTALSRLDAPAPALGAATGASWGSLNLRQAYSRATAYAAARLDDDALAAARLDDDALAAHAWKELRTGHAGYPQDHDFGTVRVEPPAVLPPVDEADVSTNASARYGLAAIECLALVGEHLR
jgi:hypothetical protein